MATKKQNARGRARYERLCRYAEFAREAKTLKTNEACAKFLVAALETGKLTTALNALAFVYRIKGWGAYADWLEATSRFVGEVSAPKTTRRRTKKREAARA